MKRRRKLMSSPVDCNASGIKKLSAQSEAFLNLLTKRGLVEDPRINDEKIRQMEKEKKRRMLHNTKLLLQHYRDITWMLECFPTNIAEELEEPLHDLDALLSAVYEEIEMENRRLEGRLKSINRSRMLLDRLNEALTVLKQKPRNGTLMYNIMYNTYVIPEKLTHTQLIYRLDISTRHYYRLRQQAINILSIRLWAAPAADKESWLDVLTLLEDI
jgi:DNA-directed RNA polymerase specialized sigma subunit